MSVVSAPGPAAPGEVARRMRDILGSAGFRTEGHRKAAIRRVLHEAAAGMNQEELARLVAEIKARFPDRLFEAASRLKTLEARLAETEKELAGLRGERESLSERARLGHDLLARLYETALGASSSGVRSGVGGSVARPTGDAQALARFVDAIEQILVFSFDQETAGSSIEETLGRGGPVKKEAGSISDILKRMARGEGKPQEDLHELERRLRRLRLLPAALMAGAQQSWKGGTRGLLEYLDPKTAEQEVSGKLPGLREAAVLKELRRRYEQVWDEMDKNITHYFRGTFETVYSEKMEGRP